MSSFITRGLKRSMIFSLTFTLFTYLSFGQCLQEGGIGGFEMATFSDDYFNQTQGNGTFTLTTAEKYSGNQSLQVDITVAGSWQVRMLNTSCNLTFSTSKADTVSFFLKGIIGNKVNVSLMDNFTELVSSIVTIDDTDWKEYQVILTPTINTSAGKIKLAYQDVGTYYVDELVVNKTNTGPLQNWYVSDGLGNDNLTGNNGRSASAPLKSIAYAIKQAWQPGDTIFVMNGTYQNANYGSGALDNPGVVEIFKSDNLATSENAWLVPITQVIHQKFSLMVREVLYSIVQVI